jgi:hypothetical protein
MAIAESSDLESEITFEKLYTTLEPGLIAAFPATTCLDRYGCFGAVFWSRHPLLNRALVPAPVIAQNALGCSITYRTKTIAILTNKV